MYIGKLYKKLGGKYAGPKNQNLKNWRNEKWIVVTDYLNDIITICGTK